MNAAFYIIVATVWVFLVLVSLGELPQGGYDFLTAGGLAGYMQGIGTVVASAFAWRAFKAWREQERLKAKVEPAREALKDLASVQEALSLVRFRLASIGAIVQYKQIELALGKAHNAEACEIAANKLWVSTLLLADGQIDHLANQYLSQVRAVVRAMTDASFVRMECEEAREIDDGMQEMAREALLKLGFWVRGKKGEDAFGVELASAEKALIDELKHHINLGGDSLRYTIS